MHSALYQGWVRHRRNAPARNHFRYRVEMLYLDLAELPHVFDDQPFWGRGRPHLAWFRRADYLGDAALPLEVAVRQRVAEHSGLSPRGPIRMLTHARMLGYVFNPVTFYYCFDEADRHVEAIVAEITNTPWLQRHTYVLVPDAPGARSHAFRFPKAFHVSPFLPMGIEHVWHFGTPGARLAVHMVDLQDGQPVLDATLRLERREIRRHTLTAALLRHPLRAFQITAAIYLQALRLWWKHVPFHPHPDRSRPRERGATDVQHLAHTPGNPHAAPAQPPRASTRREPLAAHHGRHPLDS